MKINPLELIQAFASLSFPQLLTVIAVAFGIGCLYFQFHRLSFRHLYDKRKHQIDRIESYLNSDRIKNPALSSVLNGILVAEKENQIFAHVYGYSLHAGLREKLMPLVLAQNSPVSWYQVKGARPYLKIEKGELLVRYKTSDIWKNRLSSLFSAICLTCALALWVIVGNPGAMTSVQKIIVGFFSIPMLAVSLVVLSWSVGFEAALQMERWLNRAGESN